MNDKFFDLGQAKQERIINAALKIFSMSGYRYASTDDIVREAGISKGLLFHYFESKIGLYTFLFEYSARFMLLEHSREVSTSQTDLFALVRQMQRARMQVMKRYPYMQQFINQCMQEEYPEAAAATQERRLDYRERMNAYAMQADYAPYERIGDSHRLIRLLHYMISGVTREISERYDFTPEKLFDEICAYLDLLERAFKGERE